MIYQIFSIFIPVLISVSWVECLEKEFTITVEPGRDMCFFQTVNDGYVVDIEYQVIDGGHGDLDINFQLSEPAGRVVFADFKKSDNIHRLEVKMSGDYKFCFDNTFSNYNAKTVFFELIVEKTDGEETDPWGDEIRNDIFDGLSQDEFYDMKMQDIQDVIGRVRTQLTKVRHLQDLIQSFEARDRNVAEENFHKVNTWSMFQIAIMVAVGIIQVIMVKSLFDDNSVVHKVYNRLK